jgi:hypothetical protein
MFVMLTTVSDRREDVSDDLLGRSGSADYQARRQEQRALGGRGRLVDWVLALLRPRRPGSIF